MVVLPVLLVAAFALVEAFDLVVAVFAFAATGLEAFFSVTVLVFALGLAAFLVAGLFYSHVNTIKHAQTRSRLASFASASDALCFGASLTRPEGP